MIDFPFLDIYKSDFPGIRWPFLLSFFPLSLSFSVLLLPLLLFLPLLPLLPLLFPLVPVILILILAIVFLPQFFILQ